MRIVVGVDLSVTGDNALRAAMDLARSIRRSELHPTYVMRVDKGTPDAKRVDILSERLHAALDELKAHVSAVCAPSKGEEGYSQETVLHVRLGQPAHAIHQVAVDVDADIVVVGTHGRGGVEKLILGSVAEELVRTARLPVLVAHPRATSELARSERVEPPRPGESPHEGHGLSATLHLEFVPRTSHISCLL
jgi:nucleotide-binding universal stress UspA family protein